MDSRIRRSRSHDVTRDGKRGAWRREPLAWLATAVFAASVAGSVWTIVVATRNADEPLPTHERRVVGVPITHAPARATTAGDAATTAGDDESRAVRR
jgi:hypothetical protein